ncbi:MAG: hypothetical protein J6S67_19940 [Methanobrevibacter sp.]|nr:hypothetical protein [Methanobrevibacter sp.]
MQVVESGYFNFKDLSPEEKTRRGILGRLYGDCADIKMPTRNGRGYSEKVFDNSFKEGTVACELLKNGGIPGECGHPADRTEIDMEKIAIMMPEKPRKDKNGKLIGYWDILDTPCGRIAYQLAKYGFKLGISSRGTGDVIDGYDGSEVVDPDTYDFQCFDLVVVPAVESARLTMVESLDTKKSLNESLSQLIESEENSRHKEIMVETLNELNIDLSKKESEDIPGKELTESMTAEDNGVNLVEELQKSLVENKSLKKQLEDLHERLSVRYTKEAEQAEEIDGYKKTVQTLKESLQESNDRTDRVTEQSRKKSIELLKMSKEIEELNETISRLKDDKSKNETHTKTLKESLSKRNAEIEKLKSDSDGWVKEKEELHCKIETLTESVEDLKKDSAIKNSNLSLKLSQANSLLEKYKKVATIAVDRYIGNQASRLGVTAEEIKNRLSEHYSFEEIDKVCEQLQKSILNVRKLPFETTRDKKIRVEVKESKKPTYLNTAEADDEVDDSLLELAGLRD